jgi:hypothetical protein
MIYFFDGDYRIIPNGVNLEHFSPSIAPFPEYMDGKQNPLSFKKAGSGVHMYHLFFPQFCRDLKRRNRRDKTYDH